MLTRTGKKYVKFDPLRSLFCIRDIGWNACFVVVNG